MNRYFTLVVLLLAALSLYAQKPQWVGDVPKELNDTYQFVEIVSIGDNLNEARADALLQLAHDRRLNEAAMVKVETGELTNVEQKFVNGELQEVVDSKMDIKIKVSGDEYKLQAAKVDEYITKKDGMTVLHTLFIVATCDNPKFDRTRLTASYGAAPVFMSVIPGLGQWHKGSKVKGICMFAAEAAAVAGIIICEDQRATYIKKAKEQPKFLKTYTTKADNWETGRNISIGVAAGIWLYNIIDAAVAKGARKVVVNRANGSGLSIRPIASPDGAGVSLAYRF